MSRLRLVSSIVFSAALLAAPAVARASTFAVDDDRAQCPAAQFQTVQAAVDAAAPGDTVAICPGTYAEGTGAVGSDALTIGKSLTIKGAGADLVTIVPRRSTPTGGRIAESPTDIRNGRGDIVLVAGTPTAPVDVGISGVTVAGDGVFAEAGVVYLDAEGELVRDRITGIATSVSETAYQLPGGYRYREAGQEASGYGIAQVTAAGVGSAGPVRPLTIDHTRVDAYNKLGILIDGGTGAGLPSVPSGIVNEGRLEADQVIGRVQCLAFNTPKPPPYVLGGKEATPEVELPGNCSAVKPTLAGPLFGQDGVLVAGGAKVAINDSTIAQNLVDGEGAPVYSTYKYKRNKQTGEYDATEVPSTTGNANLVRAAGVRLIGAGPSTVTDSNITDNGYGVVNLNAAGSAPAIAAPVAAIDDWWGLGVNATDNTGPAVSPTVNPFAQENPVNGTAGPEGSTAVHFRPFRAGSEPDPDAGEWPAVCAPLPVDDAPPTVTLSTDKHDYDRGATVQLTATAVDDFGVTSISFYDGTEPIGTVTPPAATASLAIPADAACTGRTLSAVATDFLGQTGSGTTEIAVTGPDECKGTPPPKPGPPTVRLHAPKTIRAKGATFKADAAADTAAGATIANVQFFVGRRKLCTDFAAPFSCRYAPTGAEVGGQSVRAVATDTVGQTAADAVKVKIAKFAPAGFPLRVRAGHAKKGRPRLVRVLTGRLVLPRRVSRSQACRSGTVAVTVTRKGQRVLPSTQVSLHRNCRWKLRFTAARLPRSKFLAVARFGGNAVLRPASTTRRFH